LVRVHQLPVFSTKTHKEAEMNPEHVSVEDRGPQTSFSGIPSTQGSLVCPSWIPSKPVSEDSYSLELAGSNWNLLLEMRTMKNSLIMIALIALVGCINLQTTDSTPKALDISSNSQTVEVVSIKAFPNEVLAGEIVIFIVEIRNTGARVNLFTLILNVNGKENRKRNVEIAAQVTRRIPFQFMHDMPGKYQISAGDKEIILQVGEKRLLPSDKPKIALFTHDNTGPDHILILPLLEQLGINYIWSDYKFINNRENFFEKSGKKSLMSYFFLAESQNYIFLKLPALKQTESTNPEHIIFWNSSIKAGHVSQAVFLDQRCSRKN